MGEDGGPSSGTVPSRADMVDAARRFMLMPKVRETSFESQRTFLLGKGITEAEIVEARASIPSNQLGSQIGTSPQNVQYSHQVAPQQNKILSLAQSAVVLGSISYAGYRFMRSFILPKFFDIPDPATEEIRLLQSQVNDLQNSIKFIMDSVSQTTQQLASQQAEITRALYSVSNRDAALNRVESGISAVKSLLLNRHNFSPIPITAPSISNVPSWQQTAIPTTSATMTTDSTSEAASGYATPANFRDSIGDSDPQLLNTSLKEELEDAAFEENKDD